MSAGSPGAVLIAYDGSAAAAEAIDATGRLLPGARALVVTVWASVRPAAAGARVALPQGVIEQAVRNLDAAAQEAAGEMAQEGADRARAAGLHAVVLTIEAEGSVAATILRVAAERDVIAVVLGSRGGRH